MSFVPWIAAAVLAVLCWAFALRRERLIGEREATLRIVRQLRLLESECPERIADALDVLIKNAIDRVSTKGELKRERSRHAQQEQLQ